MLDYAQKMLRIKGYDIPDNVYKEDAIPNEIVNQVILDTIKNDKSAISTNIMFMTINMIMFPEDEDQVFNIATFCESIEREVCK